MRVKEKILSISLVVISLAVTLGVGEMVIRLKNSSMTNYDIEMWRYANELKERSQNPELAFNHVHSRSAILQNVEIRLNERGLRGGGIATLPAGGRRILLLGGSVALGWGVPENQTAAAVLEDLLNKAGQPTQVLNAGVGNYNAERYVSRFFAELEDLRPTDIVVQFFLRDAEALSPGGGNWLLRNSELAVTFWIAYHRLFDHTGEDRLVDHYRKVYEPSQPGFKTMVQKLSDLADYAKKNGVRLYFAMTPDVHNLINYKFSFIHEAMRNIVQQHGYTFIDLLSALEGHPPEQLFAMPGDPHPNAYGNRLMAEKIFSVVKNIGLHK